MQQNQEGQNQISLFGDNSRSQVKEVHPHVKQSKRPTKLDLTALQPHRQKWAECKIYGKNIHIRSYAGACAINQEIYVYGGLQLLNGVLSDFHKINIKPKENTLLWKMVEVKKGKPPGPRAKHGLVGINSKIYLIGGIRSSVDISNEIHVYDIVSCEWQRLYPKGAEFPPLQTFGCALVKNDRPKIITICGYNGMLCESTNAVYCYDISSNQISVLYDHSVSKGNHPSQRLGCMAAFDNQSKIYIFGGKSEEERLNDLWEFDLQKGKYQEIHQDQQFKPVVRNGHSINYYNGKLFLYGGIHDITWELDDLHIYDIGRREWNVLETDSARKKKSTTPVSAQRHSESPSKKQKKEMEQEKNKRKSHSVISPNLLLNRKGEMSSTFDIPETQSPTKTTNQLKYKAFLIRKAEMLKNFQVKQEQKAKFINIQPSSQAMKNSLDMIGSGLLPPDSPSRPKKLQMAKSMTSRFMQPLVITTCFIPGKKPCARDGHNAVLIDKNLVFFGGDRHHMSFNDMYILHLDAVIHELPKYNP